MNKSIILEHYKKTNNKYKTASELGLNKNYVSSLVDRHFPNSQKLDLELEKKVLELMVKYPYTGTITKISKILKVSRHNIIQLNLKTNNKNIVNYFLSPKCSVSKLTDHDIQDILDGSKDGVGHDLMGIMKNIDGGCIRRVRKKLLTKDEYKKYHSINRFYEGDYNSYYNNRGDKFLSTLEEKVADYLFEKGINYHSNVRLNFKNKNYSPDIYLPDTKVFIEIFGMSNYQVYKNNMDKKIKYYRDNNIKCLFLYEEHFYPKLNFQTKVNQFLKETKGNKYNQSLNIIIN